MSVILFTIDLRILGHCSSLLATCSLLVTARSVRILLECFLVTTCKRSLRQGNIFSTMCQEFCSQGGSASVHAGIPPPLEQASPWSRQPQTMHPHPHPPPGSRPTPAQCMLGDTVNKWAVCILLECNLVIIIYAYFN